LRHLLCGPKSLVEAHEGERKEGGGEGIIKKRGGGAWHLQGALQGYLAHKKQRPPKHFLRALDIVLL